MRTLLRLFFSLLFIPLLSSAQKLTLSPKPFVDYSFDNMKVIGQDTGGFYLLQSNLPLELDRDRVGFRNRKYKVAYYTNGLAESWTREVEPLPSGASVESIVFANGRLLIGSSGGEKNTGTVLYGRWINRKGRDVKSQAVHTLSSEGPIEKLKVVVSRNQLLLGFVAAEYISDEKQVMHYVLTDSTFTVLEYKKLVIPYGEKRFSIDSWSLSDNGDLHLLGVRSVRVQGGGRKREEDYILYSCPLTSDIFTEYAIGEQGKEVTSAAIAFDNLNNKLVCTGFYADRTAATGAGIIYASLAMKGERPFEFHSSPIDNQTQLKILGERNRNYDVGLVYYPIQKVILRNDGGVVLIAEAFYANDYSYYDYFTQSYTRSVEYHYNNIVTASINTDGSIHWLNIIRKNQVSTDDGGAFSSFCPVLTNLDFVMIYNSDISRSSEIMTTRIITSGSQGATTRIRASNKLLLYSRSGKQISANEVIIPCISRKKLMLAKITF